jgi:CheY-like chemotaxis protein
MVRVPVREPSPGEVRSAMAATILIAEDERKLRELVRSYLEQAGFTVLTTASGAEALSLAASAAPDLLILDLGLPDVSGEAVAQELRIAGTAPPILMLTARSGEEDRVRGLELGADDYVTKPFSPRELVLRAQAILRRGGQAAPDEPVSYGGGTGYADMSSRATSASSTRTSRTCAGRSSGTRASRRSCGQSSAGDTGSAWPATTERSRQARTRRPLRRGYANRAADRRVAPGQRRLAAVLPPDGPAV